MVTEKTRSRFDWVDGLKAFAIIGILLNHFVEEFGEGPWFSNPSYDWPSFQDRLSAILPNGTNWLAIAFKFLGWLGDMGPGVFILLSGFTLTLSQLRSEKSAVDFYRSRILRIFPLYIAIHILVVAFIVFVDYPPGLKVTSPYTILSFLGLRFTDSLFFYINPSWWFIWLIIQLYLFFPFLLKWLNKRSLFSFLAITFLITILSRLAGIMHLTYSNNLYFWMTGLFAGTRVFEFAIGMVLAKLLSDKPDLRELFPYKPYILFIIFLTIYALGFVFSWTYTGSLISNILITIGLSGIFYGFYNLGSQFKLIKKSLLFIGRNSFSVFLIHQPFMQFASDKLQGLPKIFWLLAIVILSFPVGYLLEKIVNIGVGKFKAHYLEIEKFVTGKYGAFGIYLITLTIIIGNLLTPILPFDISKLNKLFALLDMFAITFYLVTWFIKNKQLNLSVFPLFLLILFVFYFILPPDWITLISIALLLAIVFFYGFRKFVNPFFTLLFSIFLLIVLFITLEQYLRIKRPLEVGRWGEYPALQTDPNTVYSLKPNKSTHLRYNNYDYTVRTNSMGFASPEIDLRKDDPKIFRILIVGDAFSMPEGMEYAYSYSSLMEQELKNNIKDRTIQVINGGVTGYGPNEMLAQIKYYIDTIKPDLVINEFFINEFEEVNLSEDARRKDIGFNKEESKRLQIFGYSQLVLNYRIWLRNVSGFEDEQYNYYKSLLNLYEKSSVFYSDTVINKLDNYFGEIKSLTDQKGAKLWLVYVPGQIEVSPPNYISYYPGHVNLADTNRFDFISSHKIINSLCARHKIPLLDTKEILKNYPGQPVYFVDSWHWNQTGHKLIAKMLAKEIEHSLSSGFK
jgi:peptidoglycan/LPS O-acetylase OafA/YrhL